MSRWDLTAGEKAVILGSTRRQLLVWQLSPPAITSLSPDTVYRLSYILGIYKALRALRSNDVISDGWLKRPNSDSPFNGRRPLDRMLQGKQDDLKAIRSFLDGWRQ